VEEEEARRAQQLRGGHHHWTPSSWSPQPASFVAPFCCCFVVVVLPPPQALGEYASQMLPGSSAIRRSHRLPIHVLPAPQNASFCFFAAGMGFCFAFLSNPLFSRVLVAAASHEALSQSFEIPCHFLAIGP
jgi:hypothetical protein